MLKHSLIEHLLKACYWKILFSFEGFFFLEKLYITTLRLVHIIIHTKIIKLHMYSNIENQN